LSAIGGFCPGYARCHSVSPQELVSLRSSEWQFKNGIVLIAEFNRLKKEGMKDLQEFAVKTGTAVRATCDHDRIGCFSKFLPMALPTGSGAEVRGWQLAIGGLLDGNLIDLVGASCLYYWFEKIKPRRARISDLLRLKLPYAARIWVIHKVKPDTSDQAIQGNHWLIKRSFAQISNWNFKRNTSKTLLNCLKQISILMVRQQQQHYDKAITI